MLQHCITYLAKVNCRPAKALKMTGQPWHANISRNHSDFVFVQPGTVIVISVDAFPAFPELNCMHWVLAGPRKSIPLALIDLGTETCDPKDESSIHFPKHSQGSSWRSQALAQSQFTQHTHALLLLLLLCF